MPWWAWSLVAVVAIYSAVRVRDTALDAALGDALRRAPFGPIRSLRRDQHTADSGCWLHGRGFCLSAM